MVRGVPEGVYCRGMSRRGEQCALYFHPSRPAPNLMQYTAMPEHPSETLVLDQEKEAS